MSEAFAEKEAIVQPENVLVFSLAGRAITVGEIMRAAQFRGDLVALRERFESRIVCAEYAATESLEPDGDAVQALADQFRYERDLITTEETEEWFKKRGLDSEELADHVLRVYWQEILNERVPAVSEDSSHGTAQNPQLTIDLMLTGALDRLAQDFAWRLASYREAQSSGLDMTPYVQAEENEFVSRVALEPESLGAWLQAVDGDRAWFEEMLAIEAAFRQRAGTIVTPERLARSLRSRRLELLAFEMEEIEFDSLAAAREAILCVRQDDLSMEQIAHESRYPYRRQTFILQNLPAEWQATLISTPENSLAGPFADGDLIRLFRVRRKIEPSIKDPNIHALLEEDLVKSSFEELCAAQSYKLLL